MSRDYIAYVEDISTCCEKILRYTNNITLDDFKLDDKTSMSVIRNLEIIGEAAKKIPVEIQIMMPDIEWRKAAGLRDMLVHAYFGIDDNILWDVIINKIPDLQEAVNSMLLQIQK